MDVSQNSPSPSVQSPAAVEPRFSVSLVFLVCLLFFTTSTLITFMLPETFSAIARIRVEGERTDIPPMAYQPAPAAYDLNFLQTEVEIIGSELVLTNVIQALDLVRKWTPLYGKTPSPSEVMKLLRQRLSTRLMRGTSLVDILVYGEEPKEAAEIANAIARSYQDLRQGERRRRKEAGLAVLGSVLDEQEKALMYARNKADDLRREWQRAGPNASQIGNLESADYSVVYREATNRLEELERFRQLVFMKRQLESADLRLPSSSMVEIVDPAAPNHRAVRPNKPLNMAVGLVTGLFSGLFIATVLFLAQRSAFKRRASNGARRPLPPWARKVGLVFVVLPAATFIGNMFVTAYDPTTAIGILIVLTLTVCGIAYLESARPLPPAPPGGGPTTS